MCSATCVNVSGSGPTGVYVDAAQRVLRWRLAHAVGRQQDDPSDPGSGLAVEQGADAVGVPRLRDARGLRDGDATVRQIARELGYDSEFAFARAFKRATGSAPGQYRRLARATG